MDKWPGTLILLGALADTGQTDFLTALLEGAGAAREVRPAAHTSQPPAPAPVPTGVSGTLSKVQGAAMAWDVAGVPVAVVRSWRARRYRLTLRRDGTGLLTLPSRGSEKEGRRFVEQHRDWLARAQERLQRRPRAAAHWHPGTHVLWRGELHEVRVVEEGARPQVALGADIFRVPVLDGDLRPTLEAHFARRARLELPPRTWELAAVTGVGVKLVAVRNQRSRWGSCSSSGTISLNWRLIQTPDSVRDYIIYHELMHLREMNHSARFWARVEEVCPGWRDAELWLKRNGTLLGL